jgi:hypothetical protein
VVRGKDEERLRGQHSLTDEESDGTRQKFPGSSRFADKHDSPGPDFHS